MICKKSHVQTNDKNKQTNKQTNNTGTYQNDSEPNTVLAHKKKMVN
jgi:hypothetical protein